ncbi:LacI family DNA-binding transcriptional regulator [Devosia algicola]|uniref:LacI family DNA-binding transcriptional regulator n=1 Tax=Devosia algicola TaxID=3026418 RepID=A0ABY7YSK6_9HYPH|nr:LacI family DNA-binding transcriptional regulator [Devosia algicola]WDR04356.1 LacI family DNA-binding transcriptional regulator [Devosia algicola]
MKGIRRLAKHLNISIGTVSRALNGKPDVNEETRKRVLAAAVELGYEPNQAGRSLRKGSTGAVGLMIESSPETAANSDNFFLGLIDGLQSVLSRQSLDLLVLPCPSEEDPNDYLQRMVARQLVDAMILSATQHRDPRIALLSGADIPFVTMGRAGFGDSHAWIDLDFEGVANRAIDRLVGQSHRRIAVAVPPTDVNLGSIFLDGYKTALRRHGLPFDPDLVIYAKTTEQGGYVAGDQLLGLSERPTAILLVYELMAIGLYRRLSEAQLRVGKDMAVIGFRESPRSRFLSPRLTCFRMSLHELGGSLAESLLAVMPQFQAQYPLGAVHMIWPMELVEGESDGPPGG